MISTEQNKKNDEIILKIVEEKWGFSASAFNTFKKAIEEKKFATEYNKLGLDEFGRKIIKIEDDKMEFLDKAYCEFKEEILNFDNDLYGINYSMFRERKVPVEKQKVKITNYLKEKIFETYNNSKNKRKWYMSHNHKFYYNPFPIIKSQMDIKVKEYITQYIDSLFTKIGSYRFNKKNMYLVISCNFADWLLCSTGETWSSCLSLSADYGYWSGMPCMALDKNRAMVYLTNGEIKDYIGIKVPHLISRSWVLLFKDNENDKKTIFNFIGDYPNRGSSSLLRVFKDAVGTEIVTDDLDEVNANEAKYSFKLLFVKPDKKTKIASTIYLDSVGIKIIEADGKKEPTFTYYIRGETGISFFKHKGKGYYSKEDFDDYGSSDEDEIIPSEPFKEIYNDKKKKVFMIPARGIYD